MIASLSPDEMTDPKTFLCIALTAGTLFFLGCEIIAEEPPDLANESFPIDNPLAVYRLEGNARDATGKFDGDAFGDIEIISVGDEIGIELDGIDDYLTLPVPLAEAGEGFTISLWAQVRGDSILQSRQVLLSFTDGFQPTELPAPGTLEPVIPETGVAFWLAPSLGQQSIMWAYSGLQRSGSSGSIHGYPFFSDHDEWFHMALTYDPATGISRQFIDGGPSQIFEEPPAPLSLPLNSTLFLGRSQDGTSYFRGSMRSIYFYGRVLGEEEIAALYDAF